jgi:photosystem II stability/assembly factor-like uncharacterized protein
VAYGKNTFIAVGDNGTIITSPDGVTWTGKSSETSKHLYGATFGNSVFVVVGQDGIILLSDPVQ